MDIREVAAEMENPNSSLEQVEEPVVEVEELEPEQDSGEEQDQAEAKPEEPNYKEMYEAERKRRIESQKDALKKRAKIKKLESEKIALSKYEEITDDELAKKYDTWDDMTQDEQKALRRAENAERRAAAAEATTAKLQAVDKISEELNDFLELAEAEGKYPDVREQVDEFRAFARQECNSGHTLDELAKIFTFDHPRKPSVAKPSTPFGDTKRRSDETKPKKMTWQQEEALRKNNPRQYEKMLEEGLLD